MILSATLPEQLNRARHDLRMGLPVVLSRTDGSALLAGAVESLSAERLGQFYQLGKPLLILSERRALTLKTPAYDNDIARLCISPDTSIDWLRAMADPTKDLDTPLKGPFKAQRDSDPYLCRAAFYLLKSAHLLPAVLAVDLAQGADFAQQNGLILLNITQIEHEMNFSFASPSSIKAAISDMNEVASARLPTFASNAGRVHIFRSNLAAEEHYAIEIGQPDRRKPVLTRLHSACFTGDVLGSLKCDCGPQLHSALAQMGKNDDGGVLLYLNQEGRGIGLANKLRAYTLQDQGFDTVEANHRLGFEDDERDFKVGVDILRQMGFSSVRLMTNNPRKIMMMEGCGLEVVERIPLKAGHSRENRAYLAVKAKKSGHFL